MVTVSTSTAVSSVGGGGSTTVTSDPFSIAFRAPWTVAPAPATSPPTIGVSTTGADLAVTVNGTTATRPAPTVTKLDITAPTDAALTVDKSGGAIAAPIAYAASGAASSLEVKGDTATWTIDHATGNGTVTTPTADLTLTFSNVWTIKATGVDHTLVGPKANTTWVLTGAGTGTVGPSASPAGAVKIDGFKNLTGAPNNQDKFVVGTGGSLAGTVDGGAGGFDTMVISGTHASVSTVATGPNSGVVTVDGKPIVYKRSEERRVGKECRL